MLTFYQYPNCSTCKAAKKELDNLGLVYQSIDIKRNPPQVDLLKRLVETSGLNLKTFFNTSGNSYRQLGLKDTFDQLTLDEALSLLANDGMLIKRPFLLDGDQLLQIGYRTPYKALDL